MQNGSNYKTRIIGSSRIVNGQHEYIEKLVSQYPESIDGLRDINGLMIPWSINFAQTQKDTLKSSRLIDFLQALR